MISSLKPVHPTVKKRKGHHEPFRPGKVMHAVHRAGGSITLAAHTAAQLERWAENQHKKGKAIHTHHVHHRVVRVLKEHAPGVARAFEHGAHRKKRSKGHRG